MPYRIAIALSAAASSGTLLIGLCLLVIGCGGDQVGELIVQLEHQDVDVRRAAAHCAGRTGGGG